MDRESQAGELSKVYRIQDISTGLFSTGGAYPSFNKNGKIWLSLGNVKKHLQLTSYDNNVELVEYSLTIEERTPLKDL